MTGGTNAGGPWRRPHGRRIVVLAGAALAVARLKAAHARDIQSKISARYVTHPGPGGADCARCQFFEPERPGAPAGHCMVVAGLVASRGYCDFYTPR